MSEYEKFRQENIRKNQEMLQALGLADLSDKKKSYSSSALKRPSSSTLKSKSQKIKTIEPEIPTRRSARLRGIKVSLSTPNLIENTTPDSNGPVYSGSKKKEFLPPLGSIVGLENSGESENKVQYFKLIAKQIVSGTSKNIKSEDNSNAKNPDIDSDPSKLNPVWSDEYDRETLTSEAYDISSLKKIFKNISIRHEEANISIVDSRIYSIAFHPAITNESLLVCAGDKGGLLGFWRVRSDDYVSQNWRKHCTPLKSSVTDSTETTVEDNNKDTPNTKSSKRNKENKFEISTKIIGKNDKINNISTQDDELDIFSFKPHTESISNVIIPQQSSNHVYTAAYDGTIRVLDLEKPTSFNQILNLKEDNMITCMDLHFLGKASSPLVWFTTTVGLAGFVDIREGSNRYHHHQFHENRIGCISVNPVQDNIICTTSVDRTIRLWDIRNMITSVSSNSDIKPDPDSKTNALDPSTSNETDDSPIELDILNEGGSVTSSYFSPDASKLVSTSFNNIVSVWSYDKNTNKVTDKQFTRHNNRTGRWLSMFRAKWHPNLDFPQCFVVGNMDQSIDIFSGRSMQLITNISDRKRIKTVPAVAVFHPELPVIASGNASGKISIWS
ncbi:hypothetical protein BB560_002039 [Smittium megazygosporum]|uniref:DNA damage-binding protein CMR1 n=1 Tax=Smittium megazygosporum TaxID=133381 RepID=A0A2T9ZFV6_9FUNG|nr:hypothetical protein BB560_002039 [Smittium megazygosporum]